MPHPGAVGVPVRYTDMYAAANSFENFMTCAGVAGFLIVLKFFKFFAVSRKMNILWLTVQNAALELAIFGVGLMLIVFGFAFLGQLVFGTQLPSGAMHNLATSMTTLGQYILGNFNYLELSFARPDLAGLYFFLFIFIVFIIAMNLVVAIILESFQVVTARARQDERWKHVTSGFLWHVGKKLRYLILSAFLFIDLSCGRTCAAIVCCCGRCTAVRTEEASRTLAESLAAVAAAAKRGVDAAATDSVTNAYPPFRGSDRLLTAATRFMATRFGVEFAPHRGVDIDHSPALGAFRDEPLGEGDEVLLVGVRGAGGIVNRWGA
jgi:hypothetical protein